MRELIVDSFAGGGGASTGIELALGRSPDIAVNHDATALAMHEVNHPQTVHITEDVWKVDPVAATNGRPVGLAWFSPDCKHFSKARGGKPVNKNIRSLAWVVVHWANTVRPRVIILENVEEFKTWGPLSDDGRPCPDRKGATFRKWVGELKRLGYKVEHRELRACDYGAPTIRKRLFLIARRDGRPIVWPQATHGDPKSDAVRQGLLKPWRTAAEIIDWSLPCPSIFDSSEEIFAKFGLRAVRPLQPATMARIAKGVKRYVLDAARPFIVNLTHHGAGQMQDLGDPLNTVTAANWGEKAIVAPFVTGVGGRMAQSEPRSAEAPLQTLTAKADSVLVAPFGVPRYGERPALYRCLRCDDLAPFEDKHATGVETLAPAECPRCGSTDQIEMVSAGQEPRALSLETPMPVVVPTGNGASLVAPYLARTAHGDVDQNGKKRGQGTHSLEEPHGTVLASNDHALIAAHVMTMRNAGKPFQGSDEPTHTITAGGAHMHLVAAFLAQHNIDGRTGEGNAGRSADAPLSTVLHSGSHQSVVSAGLTVLKGSDRRDSAIDAPAPTATAQGGHLAETRAFLQKYYGSDQDPRLEEPLHTATAKDRFGLVTVTIDGEPYVITDIGMRMLSPRELFRAQGFPESYIIDRRPDGSPITKTDQVAKCGNSVCPRMAAALVAANYAPDEIEPAPEFLEAAE